LLAYADLVRTQRGFPRDLQRDAFMASRIIEAAQDTPPEKIAVIVGAAHAAAFATGDVDLGLVEDLPEPCPTAVTLIPYSFPRLAAQMGYAAGNRAPKYYQRAHDAGCDFQRAALEVLVEFTDHLRLRGYAVSLADTIEAFRLATTLSKMRGKSQPGLDEIREASVATLCRGDNQHVDGFLWPSVIGKAVGKVASSVGQNSLQEEFWREIRQRRLPQSDDLESFTLHLNNETEVQTSVFLQRLRVADIPYASYVGTHRGRGSQQDDDDASGHEALRRTKEVWEAQWTPSTDVALVERIVLGNTMEQVTTRVLDNRLQEAHATAQAAEVLLDAVLTACPMIVNTALSACDDLASTDDDLPSLARACRATSYLVSYGSSRELSKAGDDAILALCGKTYDRAVLRLRDACVVTDEGMEPVASAIRIIHDVAMGQPSVDREAWFVAAREVVDSYVVNPVASGLVCGLLYLAQQIDEQEIVTVVGQRLSNHLEPEQAASFLEGFLKVNATVLVKNRYVVQALDDFLAAIPADRFKDTLPILRRALGPLGKTERRYLLENVLLIHNLGEKAQAAKAVIDEKDKEKLKDMSDDLADAIDDLDDLL
jgi:hypothetical protein